MRVLRYALISALLALNLQGCIVSTVIGAATDVAVEVIKVPFKVGGAIVDGVSGSDDTKSEDKK